MTTYRCLYEFTDEGYELFQEVMFGLLDEESLDLSDEKNCVPLDGTIELTVREHYENKLELCRDIGYSLGDKTWSHIIDNDSLWAWLTYIMRHKLFKFNKGGGVKCNDTQVWLPKDKTRVSHKRLYRHRIRTSMRYYLMFKGYADHILYTDVDVSGEIFEQLSAQNSMFDKNFMQICRRLYFDEKSKGPVKNCSTVAGGTVRRIAKIKNQLEVTWDLTLMSAKQFYDLLPAEFDRFKKRTPLNFDWNAEKLELEASFK